MKNLFLTIGIVSGGQGSNKPISEAQAMYAYLVKHGIAAPSDWLMLPNKMLREFFVMIRDCLAGNI